LITKAEIQLIKSLKDKENRLYNKLFVAEGDKLVKEVITNKIQIKNIIASDEWLTKNNELLNYIDNSIIKSCSNKELERISNQKTPNNVLALCYLPENPINYSSLSNLVIALDNIQDPGNLGTIIRTADWFGINNIICSNNCADSFNPKVIQATMGAFIRVSCHYLDLNQCLSKLKEEYNYQIYTTSLNGNILSKTQIPEKSVIVMGNESKGVSKEIELIANNKIFIPFYPELNKKTSESLNVANALAITCYHFRTYKQ